MCKSLCRAMLLVCLLMGKFHAIAQSSADTDSLLHQERFLSDTAKPAFYLKIGQLYNRKGMADSGLFYLQKAYQKAIETGVEKYQCKALFGMGETEARLAEYDKALNHLFSLLKKSGEEDCGLYASKAKPVIGFIYIWQKKEKDALRYFLEAEQELEARKDTSGMIAVYANLPVCIAMNGDTLKAMTYFKKGQDLIDQYMAGGHSSPARVEYCIDNKLAVLFNSVNFMVRKEDLEVALQELRKLQPTVASLHNDYISFNLYSALSDLLFRLKLYHQATEMGSLALKSWQDEGNYSEVKNLLSVLSASSAATGDFEKAFQFLSRHNQYADSVFKLDKLEAINAAEKKYQVEKKEQEIAVLTVKAREERALLVFMISGLVVAILLLIQVWRSKKMQRILFKKQEELQQQQGLRKMAELEQTALRAQMNPHFIFNSLNSVQRYVMTNDISGVNQYLTAFASLIRQTLESSGKTFVPLEDEIKYLTTYLQVEQMRSQAAFEYRIVVGEGIEPADLEIPNMFVQPFVENSIRHGMPPDGSKGNVVLQFLKKEKLVVILEDNGRGILAKNPAEETMIGTHISMGKTLTEKRMELYNQFFGNTITLQAEDKSTLPSGENGTRITIQFPLKNR